MKDFNSLLLFIPLILIVCAIIISWLFISKIFKKYNQYIVEMKANGTYKAWAKANRFPVFFAKLFDYVAALCFAGFIFLSIAKVSFNTLILFELLFPFKLISIALYLILYLKIIKSDALTL